MALEVARKQSTIDPSEVFHLIYGDRINLQHFNAIRKLVMNDPVFDKTNLHNLTRPERFDRASRIAKRLVELGKTNKEIPFDSFMELAQREADEEIPTDLHMTMFLPSLETLASEEQRKRWVPLARSFVMLGTYAQTEMGHGSDLSRLETTATFDRNKDGFIINSPTLTSTKWWPGELGKAANTVVLMAQLIIDDVSYGVQPFLVPIRDYETHIPLKGIEVFELGPKIGYNANDNGALRLNNVFIPRDNMLMRFAQLSKDGEFTVIPGAEKVVYSIMLRIRASIAITAGDVLSRALTIAIRYAHVRKQFASKEDASDTRERQIIEYKIHQSRLFPYLAAAFANMANSEYIQFAVEDLSNRFERDDFSTLKEVHVLASGMKCFFSWIALDGIESCRRSCGGNGYLVGSGFSELYNRRLPLVTYEGENYVLIQQVTRFLIKLRKQMNKAASKGGNRMCDVLGSLAMYADVVEVVPTFCSYLMLPVRKMTGLTKSQDWMNMDAHVALWESISKYSFFTTPKSDSHDGDAIGWFTVSMLFNSMITVKIYAQWLNKKKSKMSAKLFQTLNTLGVIYSLWLLLEKARTVVYGLEGKIIDHKQTEVWQELLSALYGEILPDSVSLTDGFDHTDFLLNSTIGRYDGNIYEALYSTAKSSDLNKLGDVLSPFTDFLAKL